MSFDLARALRQIKPQAVRPAPARRPDAALPFATVLDLTGPPLLLDSCVYIDALQGRRPPLVQNIMRSRACDHSTIALAELTHLFGRLDPRHAETEAALAQVEGVIKDIPAHRLRTPDETVWGVGGILAGLLFRLGGFQPGQETKCLNDAMLYVQAGRLGATLISRNLKEFDVLDQLVGGVRLLFYRQAA